MYFFETKRSVCRTFHISEWRRSYGFWTFVQERCISTAISAADYGVYTYSKSKISSSKMCDFFLWFYWCVARFLIRIIEWDMKFWSLQLCSDLHRNCFSTPLLCFMILEAIGVRCLKFEALKCVVLSWDCICMCHIY